MQRPDMYSEMGIEALVLTKEEKTFLMMNGSLLLVRECLGEYFVR